MPIDTTTATDDVTATELATATAPAPDTELDPDVETAWELLHEVIDPEVGVNIVDLGLVFAVRIDGDVAHVRMTLTTPGCPLQGYMEDGIYQVLTAEMAPVNDTDVEIVWDPTWSPDLMTDEGKRQLGWL